jgi:hypothetical protein
MGKVQQRITISGRNGGTLHFRDTPKFTQARNRSPNPAKPAKWAGTKG